MNKKELLELCEASGATLKNKMIDMICEYGKDIFSMDTSDWMNIFKSYGSMQRIYIIENRRELSNLYIHGINTGKTVYNPFDSKKLSTDRISIQLNSNLYVSQKQINSAIWGLNESLISGCMVQLIYEGARSYLDIFNLNIEDIDYEHSTIDFKDYTVKASSFLIKYIKQYDENWYYQSTTTTNEDGNREFPLERVRNNSFIKIVRYKTTKDEYKAFINSCSRLFKLIGYSKQQVYNSGLLNFIYRKCDFSITKLSYLLEVEKYDLAPGVTEELKGYAVEYGFSSSTINIRHHLKDYYNSFMLQESAI
jgi:hypothetical protein